jgi:HPt (histidine-containing phosphotransfer) domain-containing protein
MSDADAAMRASIAAIWDRGRGRVLERVATIAAAVEAVRDGTLDEEARAAAESDAHKLAGALGSFGMPDGTDHARVLEHAFESRPDAVDADDLAAHAAALREAVERGPPR